MTLLNAELAASEREGSVPAEPSLKPRSVVIEVLSHPGAALSAAFILLVLLMAACAPLISTWTGWGPNEFDSEAINADLGGLPNGPLGGIGPDHWLGVEPQNGRDIFTRIAFGAQTSMLIAISATALTTIVGVVLGMIAGFFGAWADQSLSRLMDFLLAFPSLIFMIAILSALPSGNRPVLLVLVLSVFGWSYIARVIRGQTLSLAQREFVEAAKASGATSTQIIFREILPNLRGTILVMGALALPGFVATEAGLSFLGVGVTPPTASWGQMIARAVPWYAVDPMYFLIPGMFLFLTVLSFTVLGERVRKTLETGRS